MADIKTHLRELSVATTIGLLNMEIEFKPQDLYNSRRFLSYAKKVISNDISAAENLCDYTIFAGELQQIVDNGYKLGKKIYNNPYFKLKKDLKIQWLGNDTQKKDPIDITIGDYGFSLKEDSFILKNMGLYTLLNNLTGSNYSRGLHVFSTFALSEYDTWFQYTWKFLISYLKENNTWILHKNDKDSIIYLHEDNIVLSYGDIVSEIPTTIVTNTEYMKYTTSKTREKVFAKWISNVISNDSEYLRLKKICSETAGKRICDKINNEFKPDNIYEFFQIYLKEYYYAKTTVSETTILKVPSRNNFSSIIEFQGCRYEVPSSQLNIITRFHNRNTKKYLEFRNECRFSHGQFNGTPEAKMYVSKNTSLFDLYEPLD
jgi:hypothetical protein